MEKSSTIACILNDHVCSNNLTPSISPFISHHPEKPSFLEVKQDQNIKSFQKNIMSLLVHNDLGIQLLSHFNGDLNQAIDAIQYYYCGAYDSELDFATHIFNDHYLGVIPESVKDNIAYTMFQEALFSYDYFSLEAEGSCHVFRQ